MIAFTQPTSLAAQRAAQTTWAATAMSKRLAMVRRMRHRIAERAGAFAQSIGRPAADTLVSEVLPLADACLFLERNAKELLATKRLGSHGRPLWLHGVDLEIRREPLGVILIIGPSNYPLFLPAVQAMQALVAGNAVIAKPGRGGTAALALFAQCLNEAGLNRDLFVLLGEDPAEATAAIEAGVDKVLLTGSNATGHAVLSRLAEHGIPSVMELSGIDPVFVLPGADMDLVVAALRFGLELNGGNTCIAPRRVIAVGAGPLRVRLQAAGISLPVEDAEDQAEAVRLGASTGYALGATVFGPEKQAREFAEGVRAGVVVINDMIVPTADPRLPFGGKGASGFGVTRGAEGLLELTTVKAVCTRQSRRLPHLGPKHAGDAELFSSFIACLHGGALPGRVRALGRLIRAGIRRRS